MVAETLECKKESCDAVVYFNRRRGAKCEVAAGHECKRSSRQEPGMERLRS